MKALVLSGGGTKGAFELGALEALEEKQALDFDLVVGTSVGGLNGLFVVQGQMDQLRQMYETLTRDQIIQNFIPDEFDIKTLVDQRKDLSKSIQDYFELKGFDVSPLKDLIETYFDEKSFYESPMDFGVVVADAKDRQGFYIDKQQMKGKEKEWLLATASAYPAFPVCVIDGKEYVDGGYFDNLPIDFALQKGADEIWVIDLSKNPIHPECLQVPFIHYIRPVNELPSFLEFNAEMMVRSRRLGYLQAKKVLGDCVGFQYCIESFPIPSFFESYWRRFIRYERKIEVIHQSIRSFPQAFLKKKAQESSQTNSLDGPGLFVALLEEIMGLVKLEDETIYSYEELKKELLLAFKNSIDGEMNLKRKRGLNSLEAFQSLLYDRVHQQNWLSENEALDIYPNEYALVRFFIEMMKG